MDAETVLAAARFRLAGPGNASAPYLSAIAWALTFVEAEGIGTIGVDKGLQCHYDPKVVEEWGVELTEAVLAHECHHVVRAHLRRLPTGASPQAWNIAGDAEINDDLRKEGWKLPDSETFRIVYPERLQPPMPEGLTAEEYYASMAQQTPGEGGDGQGKAGLDPHCGGAAGHSESWEAADGDAPSIGELEQDILRRKVAGAVRECQAQGKGTGGLERWADELLNPKVDWRRELRAVVKSSIARMSGPDDFTYKRPSRRRSAPDGLIMPSTVSPIPKVAVVIDTSGSIGQRQLTESLTEVRGILDAASGRCPVTVLAVDAAVHSVQSVYSARAVKSLGGGGGTDMGKGIDAADKLRTDVCVVLTDGYTPWPADRPSRMRVIVGILPGCKGDGPPWARTIKMES